MTRDQPNSWLHGHDISVELAVFRKKCALQAKFHYAIWFEAGRWSTSFEPDSVMEFGRETASSC